MSDTGVRLCAAQIAMDMEGVRSRLNAAGQEHLLARWAKLTPQQQKELYDDIQR